MEISKLCKSLEDEQNQKKKLEGDIAVLQTQLLQLSFEADEVCFGLVFLDLVCVALCFDNSLLYLQTSRRLDRGEPGKVLGSIDSLVQQVKHSQAQEPGNGEKASVAKLFELFEQGLRTTNLYNSMILSTLSVSSHGFVFLFPQKVSY